MRKRKWLLAALGLVLIFGGYLWSAARVEYEFLRGGRLITTGVVDWQDPPGTVHVYQVSATSLALANQVDSEMLPQGWKRISRRWRSSGTTLPDPEWSNGVRRIMIRRDQLPGRTLIQVSAPTTWMDRIQAWFER